MRRLLFSLLALGLFAISTPAKEKASCGDYGTSVYFFDSPQQAAKQAVKEEKLVFVLHVSGNFEDPRFT